MLKLPLWDTPVKSYGQKSFFGKSPIAFYMVKEWDPVLVLGTIFEQNFFLVDGGGHRG